jgi:Ca-activated chloride channel family protein
MNLREALAVGVLVASTAVLPKVAFGCDLALVLAFDLSSSIDAEERTLVLHGIAEALRHPWVASAFLGQSAMVQVVVFADAPQALTGWVPVNATDDLHNLAAMLDAPMPPLKIGSGTRISPAVAFSAGALSNVECTREVLDVMTDGEDPTPINTEMFEDWQTINVLLLGDSLQGAARTAELLHGEGSFSWPLATLYDLTKALAEKMIQEVS